MNSLLFYIAFSEVFKICFYLLLPSMTLLCSGVSGFMALAGFSHVRYSYLC